MEWYSIIRNWVQLLSPSLSASPAPSPLQSYLIFACHRCMPVSSPTHLFMMLEFVMSKDRFVAHEIHPSFQKKHYFVSFLPTRLCNMFHESVRFFGAEAISVQVREWNELGLRGSKLMCTARNPWLTMSVRTASFKTKCFPVDVALKDILHIDEERMIVKTEPLVNMGYMTQYLLPKGYALAIQVSHNHQTNFCPVFHCGAKAFTLILMYRSKWKI